MTKINKTKFINALDKTGGILTQIANNLSVTRKTVYEFIDRNPDVIPFIEHEREKILDVMENSMINKAIKGDFKAQKFYLKTIGKHRGFTERVETELSGAIDNKIIFELAEPKIKELDQPKKIKEIENETSN